MKILTHEQAKSSYSPTLNRGHIVFTSLVQHGRKLLFLEEHLDRLCKGADFLFPDQSWSEKKGLIRSSALKEVEGLENHYLRITISGEILWFEKKARDFSVEKVALTTAVKKSTAGLKPPFLKQSNYLESDLELREALKKGFNEILYFDDKGFAAEAGTSNLFIVTKEGMVKTPPVCSYVLQGITREKLLSCLQKNGYAPSEDFLNLSDLENAAEIWLTNAVKGIRFVSQFQEKTFKAEKTLFETALTLFGRYGENYE